MTKYFKYIFPRDEYRCVYCGRWMLSDFDTFMLTEEDHLLPLDDGGDDDETNRVTSCRICNMLKGNYSPGKELFDSDRATFIQEVRAYIARRRAERMADFFYWTNSIKDYHGAQ